VDIWELCTAYYSPNNRFNKRAMFELLEYGGWATGVLDENDRPEYAHTLRQQATSAAGRDEKAGQKALRGRLFEPRFAARIDSRFRIVIAGAAGGKVRSAGHLLAQGGILSGLYATQRDDYPVTVMAGHSVCEVVLDTRPIGYTGIVRPNVLALVAEEGRARATPWLAAMTAEDKVYIAKDLLDARAVDTEAQVVALRFEKARIRATRQNRAIMAAGAILRHEGMYDFEALEATVRETQRPEIAAANLEALEASAAL
jgi:2-oxoglutarate ferredoxin oxidoreductase subunit beta